MSRCITGQDRQQVTLLPQCLDDFIGEDNPVRGVEAFVNELNLASLGFQETTPALENHPNGQISLTDPYARSMATIGRGSGMVGYSVQAAAGAKHHIIMAHEVTNAGSDSAQLYVMPWARRSCALLRTVATSVDLRSMPGQERVCVAPTASRRKMP